ncbi:conjugal transfer protein MobC [Pedobacter insulae]|uniref:Type IV secretion-system coupling protein DNA-binding domain-containing protein n=1 Tax=Pedobacter insulae TaxID=414048 RepID=A0A1I2Z5R1_9SPHI|nr:conjugal transfer protein MobC [Pedobacter insulae]SFH33238.1 Type IV secretion-system coupling protein DNA-binding domain-containing protein [Pedobacter insulae]
MQTGENIQALRKIADFTGLLSLVILAIHFYIFCYAAFQKWALTAELTDHILEKISPLAVFKTELFSKSAALLLLVISLIAAKGKKDERIRRQTIATYLITGLILYSISHFFLNLQTTPETIALLYIGTTGFGYLLILAGGNLLSRLLQVNLSGDTFNKDNETFPQEERLLENEYSINLPTKYWLKGKLRNGWINVINPFRSTLLSGSAGAGKTYFYIRHVIDQHLKKGFSMLLYDFKYSDLTTLAYNKLLKYAKNFKVKPSFWVINFDDIMHRCNPLEPQGMTDITDATESARTIMLGLNREWLKKQGDFFVESAISFVTALIWYLKKYQDGKYCTLPHTIELMMVDYKRLFTVLIDEPEIQALLNPFISAWEKEEWGQLEGQIGSAKISMARLVSPKLYYVLSGNDFTLDINNPDDPKIVCLGNNPQKLQTYGAVLSLYVSRILKLVNQKDKLKCSLVFDEYPTLVADLVPTITTARSNLVSCTIGIQSIEQVKKEYGAEQANIIAGISGNIISGQVSGDSAKKLSETFGKIVQDRQSLSINSSDTSLSKSTQLDSAIPASKIASLSSGQFVGMVADNPDQKIELKMFHAEIINDHQAIALEEKTYVDLPQIRKVTEEDLQENYIRIKDDIQDLLTRELGVPDAEPEVLDVKEQKKLGGRKMSVKNTVSSGKAKVNKGEKRAMSL